MSSFFHSMILQIVVFSLTHYLPTNEASTDDGINWGWTENTIFDLKFKNQIILCFVCNLPWIPYGCGSVIFNITPKGAQAGLSSKSTLMMALINAFPSIRVASREVLNWSSEFLDEFLMEIKIRRRPQRSMRMGHYTYPNDCNVGSLLTFDSK